MSKRQIVYDFRVEGGKQRFKPDKNFQPCPVDEGDEIFPNGIFHFNITKMLAFIHSQPGMFLPEPLTVKDYDGMCSSIDDKYLDLIVNFDPVIIAEIAPGRYNLIDGNHRVEKARRLAKEKIMAYRLKMNQHINFLTSRKAYLTYIEYWNSKLDEC